MHLVQNKENKSKKISMNKKEVSVQKAQEKVGKKKMPKRSTPIRSSDAIKQSYADILKEMKASVNPQDSGLEVLSIQRTRKEEVLLVLKKEGDISACQKALDRAVGVRAEIEALVLESSSWER